MAGKVVEGTDLLARVQCSESWEFTGDAETGEVSTYEHHRHFHVTVIVPGKEPIVGHAETLEGAANAARSRVESYLKDQKAG